MNWFERITGFTETDYPSTQNKLRVEGQRLHSLANGRSYSIGTLTLPTLAELRQQALAGSQAEATTNRTHDITTALVPSQQSVRLQASVIRGDVRLMHQRPEYADALFQVASQFNLLEMVGPSVTPEQGVTRYQDDLTQGPACAMAAGAATIYRNYFADVGGQRGQTGTRQLDALADLGAALATGIGQPVNSLWQMKNGYAMCNRVALETIARYLNGLDGASRAALRDQLRIGLHSDVEVTDAEGETRPMVSQAFCSALPVSYHPFSADHLWAPFARLVLEAAYEATLWAAVINATRKENTAAGARTVLLTRLGGGAFGNADGWIHDAIEHALKCTQMFDLDVRIVSYRSPTDALQALVQPYQR